jgi:hypothetical protein
MDKTPPSEIQELKSRFKNEEERDSAIKKTKEYMDNNVNDV